MNEVTSEGNEFFAVRCWLDREGHLELPPQMREAARSGGLFMAPCVEEGVSSLDFCTRRWLYEAEELMKKLGISPDSLDDNEKALYEQLRKVKQRFHPTRHVDPAPSGRVFVPGHLLEQSGLPTNSHVSLAGGKDYLRMTQSSIPPSIFMNAVKELEKPNEEFLSRLKTREPSLKRFRFSGDGLNAVRIEGDRIKLPEVGWVKMKGLPPSFLANVELLSLTYEEKEGKRFVTLEVRLTAGEVKK